MTANDTEMRRRQVPAVTRAIGILRQLGKADEPVGVNQIARELGLIPSTCLHILRVLVEEGLVSFDPVTKRYAIDVGILPIARNAIQRNGFVSLVESRLTQLSLRFGVTGVATQLSDPYHMVVVALSQAPLPFRLQVDLGSRFPALISATGRCVAAFTDRPWPEIEERFRALRWHRAPTLEAWKREIAAARRHGYSIDRGDYIAGVTIVAVPVLDSRRHITHTLVAVGLGSQLDRATSIAVAHDLLETARAVEATAADAAHNGGVRGVDGGGSGNQAASTRRSTAAAKPKRS